MADRGRCPDHRRTSMSSTSPAAAQPSFAELFTPKLVTVFREGYGWQHLRADAIAGLTVAIVALPLSMAIAIASGASPAQGLYAAIVGGFLVSALGGSRLVDRREPLSCWWRPRCTRTASTG